MFKKIAIISGILVFFGIILTNLPRVVEAQGSIVANVNIYDANLISQNKNTLIVGFDIANKTGVQPDVKYSIQLVKVGNKGANAIADTYTYPEVLNLGENVTLHREVTYNIPSGLGGKYELWIISRNSSGLMLGLSRIEEIITLAENSAETIEILPETCYITVENNAKKTRYTLTQGVDIDSKESLVLTCTVRSNFASLVEVRPKFETFYRTIFGEKVSQIGDTTDPLSLKPGENKSLSFILPKAEKPQAYDVKFSLLATNVKTVSNVIVAHYVLRGASATIQNITLDKDIYYKGDIAKLMIFWSGSADGFPDSRAGTSTAIGLPSFDMRITSNTEVLCGEKLNYRPSTSVEKDIKIIITQDCISPKVSITLTSKAVKDGESVSATKDFKITTDASRIPAPNNLTSLNKIVLYFSVGVILILIIAGMLYLKKKKAGNAITLGMLLVIFGLSFSMLLPHRAEAETYYYDEGQDPDGWKHQLWNNGASATVTVNLNKSSYAPGDTVSVSVYGDSGQCANAALIYTYGRLNDSAYNANVDPAGIGQIIPVYSTQLLGAAGAGTWGYQPLPGALTVGTRHVYITTYIESPTSKYSHVYRQLIRPDPLAPGYYIFNEDISFTVVDPYIDIGLRVWNGTTAVKIAAVGTPTSAQKLRIAKNNKVYGISLVNVGDVAGSKIKVQHPNGNIYELRKYTGTGGIVN